MGKRCGGVSIKVVTKLAERFGWQDIGPSKRKSVASKEELAQLKQRLEQQAKDREKLEEQVRQQAEQVQQQAEQLDEHARDKTRLQRELSDVKKNMVKRKPGDVEVTRGGRGGGSGGLAQVQSQSQSQSQSGENAQGQSDKAGTTKALEMEVHEQGERIDMLSKQVAELQDGRSGQQGASGQAAEDAASITGDGAANDQEGGTRAEEQERKKKAADLSGAKSELFGRAPP